MNTILIQLAIAAAVFLGGLATGIKWHAGQDALAAQELAQAEARDRHMRAEKIAVAAVGLEKAKETVRTQFVTIEKEVDRVVEKPIYLQSCFDDDGLRVVNRAIGAGRDPGQPAPAVPASGAAGRPPR